MKSNLQFEYKSMSTAPIMFLTLGMTSVTCLSLNSWIAIWVMLELNTLSFCSLMKTHDTNKTKMTEMSMKYFVIQSMASALLITSSVSLEVPKNLAITALTISAIALMVKVAASPFHQWFVNITKSLNWAMAYILMTWQKLAPTLLVMYQTKNMMMGFLTVSAMVGSVAQMNKKLTMEIMAYSSIFNLSWIILAILSSMKVLFTFLAIYWMSVGLMVLLLKESNMKIMSKENKKSSNKWLWLMVLINLAGIPPMAGFVSKWLVFSETLYDTYVTVVLILLVSSSINLYIYMRMTNFLMLKSAQDKQKMTNKTKKSVKMIIMVSSTYPILLISL